MCVIINLAKNLCSGNSEAYVVNLLLLFFQIGIVSKCPLYLSLSLYPYISSAFIPHQRSFFVSRVLLKQKLATYLDMENKYLCHAQLEMDHLGRGSRNTIRHIV